MNFRDANEIRRKRKAGVSCLELAKEYDVDHTNISRISRGLTWNTEKPSVEGNWKKYPQGEKLFWVCSTGKVFSSQYRIVMKPDIDKDGYSIAILAGKKIKLHRLVLMVFDRKPKKGDLTRHLDGDVTNNDISNLAWGTRAENEADKKIHGTNNKHTGPRLNKEQVKQIRKSKESPKEISKKYNVPSGVITRILKYKTYKFI